MGSQRQKQATSGANIGSHGYIEKHSKDFIMPRGGARSGAGRPAGSENTDTAKARQALSDMVGGHVVVALTALADIAAHGQSEGARVSAACAILDRCFGKPRQTPFSAPLHGLPEDPLDSFRSW